MSTAFDSNLYCSFRKYVKQARWGIFAGRILILPVVGRLIDCENFMGVLDSRSGGFILNYVECKGIGLFVGVGAKMWSVNVRSMKCKLLS